MHALYSLKSKWGSPTVYIQTQLNDIWFKSSVAGPNVWLRKVDKLGSEKYYECVISYVYYMLDMSHEIFVTEKYKGAFQYG